MKLKRVFERKETKYLLTQQQFTAFLNDLEQTMQRDEFGLHTIQSLYYDTTNDFFVRHSIEKPAYKEKFRVRSYGQADPSKSVFLEIKKKINGIVYKRRLPIAYTDYLEWEKTGILPAALEQNQIAHEIDWLFLTKPDLHAKVLIAYDRMSYFLEEDETFRVTFDQNIRYRTHELELDKDTYKDCRPVAEEIGILMEVKAMGAYPIWFADLLTDYEVRKSSFSKYAQTYQRHLFVPTTNTYVAPTTIACKGEMSYVS